MPKIDLAASKVANLTNRLEYTSDTLDIRLLDSSVVTIDPRRFVDEVSTEPLFIGLTMKLVLQVKVGMRFWTREVPIGPFAAGYSASTSAEDVDLSLLGTGSAEVWVAVVSTDAKVVASVSTRVMRVGSILKWRISDSLGSLPWRLSADEELPWLEVNLVSGLGEYLQNVGASDPSRIVLVSAAVREATLVALTMDPEWQRDWLDWCKDITRADEPILTQGADVFATFTNEARDYAEKVAEAYVIQQKWLNNIVFPAGS